MDMGAAAFVEMEKEMETGMEVTRVRVRTESDSGE
jgi:hypothetical protein